jgi:hypothetical protein
MVVRAQQLWVVLSCALALTACTAFDAELLKHQSKRKSGSTSTGQQQVDAAAPTVDAGDAALPDAGRVGTGGTTGGSGGTTSTGAAGNGPTVTECVLNIASLNGVCPIICPETCNGEDDDCDGTIDEDLENACMLPNAAAACARAHCVIVQCSKGYRDCDHEPSTGCESPPGDVNNCGACGTRCSFTHAMAGCVDDKCVPIGCDSPFADCDSNPMDCETSANTAKNCMGCGKTCTDADVANATASCETGVCSVAQCFTGYGDCNTMPVDGCEQMLATNAHCGACSTPCNLPGSFDDCATGVCLAQSCEPGYDDCDGNRANGCESLDLPSHCGACDKTCDTSLLHVTSASCSNQQCAIGCPSDFADCDHDPSTGCETPITSLQRCGSCDTPCAIAHAEASCDAGTCNFVRCMPGWGDCNDDHASPTTDGCETSLNVDDHCGSCTNNCKGTTTPVCSGDTCSMLACPNNTADCDHDGKTCEADLQTDVANCGACGNACAFATGSTPHASGGLTCAAGQCKPVCDALFADCTGGYRDGCETALTTTSNCGACGTGCSIQHATATCATGACRVSQCAQDWSDCDNDAKSCETQLGNTSNCTGCNMACTLANAVASCAGSAGSHSCAISSCSQSYFADCDAMASNGCEVDKRSDPKHCGACTGADCTTDPNVAVNGTTCSNGACVYACKNGFGTCNSMPGCETPLTTLTDCGSCGTTCTRANATASCSTGTCTLAMCNMGFKDCDGNPADGCEPLTTLTNCGDCGVACSVVNGTASCATQTCQVAMCSMGWDDCDASPTNGCERNINPPAMNGLGPCLPDTGCVHQSYNGQDYYFCPTLRTWADARTHCQQQLLGELVHINDMNENMFVQSHLAADSWIGATDSAVEGVWRWANDGTQVLSMGSTYPPWQMGEPNNTNGNENCALSYTTGFWNDQLCTDTRGFVCEVQLDLCPMDPNKINPGQCNCGTPDTDTDNDGTADCNDGCPNDPKKIAPGVCLCGKPDIDSDGDGVLDCNDGCPNDPNKTAPGVCLCGKPDVDSDGDTVLDCNDSCPLDPTVTTGPCGYDYSPTNFDPTGINFGKTPTTNLNCQATTTIDTSGSVTITNWCGTAPTPIIQTQSGGPDVVVLPMQALTIASTTTLRVIGSRPLILAVRGDVVVNGAIDARAVGATPGAGGNACTSGNGGNGASDSRSDEGAGGGGGAGFGAAGGGGGRGDRGNGTTAGGSAGATEGSASLSPLHGGCKGGNGGNGSGTGGAGGAGGGAIQISAGGTITLSATAVITASGGAGAASGSKRDGGGGGGSGGAVFLEGHVVTVNSAAWVTTNAGSGASGHPNSNQGTTAGTNGSSNTSARAPGGAGSDGGGDGGDGGASAGGATGGGDGQCTGFLCPLLGTTGAAGGGGGGGVGRIRMHGTQSCSLSGHFSPSVGQTNCP